MDALSKLMEFKFDQKTITFQGQTFIVKEMNAEDKTNYETGLYEYKQIGKELKVTPKMENHKSKLVVHTLHDEQGNKIFKGIEDLPIVNKLPGAFVDLVASTATSLNGLDQEDVSKN